MAEAVRLQQEVEGLKAANKELLELCQELEEEIRLLKSGEAEAEAGF